MSAGIEAPPAVAQEIACDRPSRQALAAFPPELAAQEALREGRPHFLGIHLLPRCNFRCQKCFIGEMRALETGSAPLEIEEMQTIITNARRAGIGVLGLTGAGEPLADPRVFDVIRCAHEQGIRTHLVTNASMLTRERAVFLRDHEVTLVISLDSVRPATFATLTGTNEEMLRRVLTNLAMAQEVFKEGAAATTSCGATTFRLAVHMTLGRMNEDQIEEVRHKIDPSVTLFSLSPLAETGTAALVQLRKGRVIPSERHIVEIERRKDRKRVCGFFLHGIDINFDGELLLDAHAIGSRGLLGNIREFGFDVKKAFAHMRKTKRLFLSRFMDGFCPVRSPRLAEGLKELARRRERQQVKEHIERRLPLIKFAFRGEGARRFLSVLESKEYTTGRDEEALITQHKKALSEFLRGRQAVVLGCGDGRKLVPFIGGAHEALAVDMSEELLRACKERLPTARFLNQDFGRFVSVPQAKGTAFVLLGGTLGNEPEMEGFLRTLARTPGARLILGMELVKRRTESAIREIVKEYENEEGFRFVMTPLERHGIARSNGRMSVRFNRRARRIEEWFVPRSPKSVARHLGLNPKDARQILVSCSAKLTSEEFEALARRAGFRIIRRVRKGKTMLLLLESGERGDT